MANRFFSPNQQFFANPVTGAPLAGGMLFFYASGTATPLNTYSDSALTVANTNPVILDSNGYSGAVFLQNLAYKVVCTDINNVQLWTEDPVWSSDYSTFAQFQPWSGNPNGLVAGTASTQGSLPGSSTVWDYINNTLYVCTVTGTVTTAVWTAVNAASTATFVPPPTGRLTPTSGTPVINSDVVSNTNLVYTPYNGNTVPIYNGVAFTSQNFTELTLTLNAAHAASTLYDVFIFNNSGVLTLVTGPAWSVSTAGSCARGTGASTTQISLVSGIWTNAVQITGRNSTTTYTIGANTATYLGTIYIDTTAGQVTCNVAWGFNRKFGIWNAYNRIPIVLQEGDSTSSWTYATATFRASNNNPSTYSSAVFNTGSGTNANGINVVCGLPEEVVTCNFLQNLSTGSGQDGFISIGVNSITSTAGLVGLIAFSNSGVQLNTLYVAPPALGLNIYTAMEKGGTATFSGTNASMMLQAAYRG